MVKKIDRVSLHALCAAIASTGFDVSNRIKSIAQVAHEYLQTSSITVYAYSRISGGLDIVAMPGVENRDFMRGPTDRLIFEWESPNTKHGRDGVWLETQEQFQKYMNGLARTTNWPETKAREGDFRTRELKKSNDQECSLAVAKIYLWKGIGQTSDKVGVMFFNYVSRPGDSVFTPGLKEAIRFVACLTRELLIDSLYHTLIAPMQWSPDGLLRELDVAFPNRSLDDNAILRVEARITSILSNAALSITQSFGGYSDLVFLVGERLGRLVTTSAGEPAVRTVLIPTDSISGRCISDRRYFVGNEIGEGTQGDPNRRFGRYPPEFGIDPAMSKSLMVVPIADDRGVRALIRVGNSRPGSFLDAQAKAMQTLEHVARFALSRLDEFRQRQRMAAALGFWTQPSTSGYPAELLRGVLSALGAEWGAYWPLKERDNPISFYDGTLVEKESVCTISPDDPVHDIVINSESLTWQLVRSSRNIRGARFCALHELPEGSRCLGGDEDDYFLQKFAHEENRSTQKPGKNELPTKAARDLHTRLAFVVWLEDHPVAVVWIAFRTLHEISWWERDYIFGLSTSLGEFLHIGTLNTAIDGFRHMMPSLAAAAAGSLDKLLQGQSESPGRPASDLKACVNTIAWRAAEVKALLPQADARAIEIARGMFGAQKIRTLVQEAIAVGSDFAKVRLPWVEVYQPEDVANDSADAFFYVALLNLVSNVVNHGWRFLRDTKTACIWIRRSQSGHHVCVGNTGNPIPEGTNPFEQVATQEGHGTGLRVIRTLIRKVGGDICFLTGEDFYKVYAETAPEEMKQCVTFFEFDIPLVKEH